MPKQVNWRKIIFLASLSLSDYGWPYFTDEILCLTKIHEHFAMATAPLFLFIEFIFAISRNLTPFSAAFFSLERIISFVICVKCKRNRVRARERDRKRERERSVSSMLWSVFTFKCFSLFSPRCDVHINTSFVFALCPVLFLYRNA